MKRNFLIVGVLLFIISAVSVSFRLRELASAAPSQPQPSGRTFNWVSESSGADLNKHIGISYNGRYIMFQSDRSDLVSGDTNGKSDVFVKDVIANTIERVSVADDDSEYPNDSTIAFMSTNGRFVLFSQDFSGNPGQIMLRDRFNQTTVLASSDASGNYANAITSPIMVTDDGRYVLFTSPKASNLHPAGSAHSILYRKDMQTGAVTKLTFTGTNSLGHDWYVDWGLMSADATRTIIRAYDIDAYDRDDMGQPIYKFIQIERANSNEIPKIISEPTNTKANASVSYASFSRNGRFILFGSRATNINDRGGDDISVEKLYFKDDSDHRMPFLRVDGPVFSSNYEGPVENGVGKLFLPGQALSYTAIHDDGTKVGFQSSATNLEKDYTPTPVDDMSRKDSLYVFTVPNWQGYPNYRYTSGGAKKMIANQEVDGVGAFAPGASTKDTSVTFAFTTDDNIDSGDTTGRDIYWTGPRTTYAVPDGSTMYYTQSYATDTNVYRVNNDGSGGVTTFKVANVVGASGGWLGKYDILHVAASAGNAWVADAVSGASTSFPGSACRSAAFFSDGVRMVCLSGPTPNLRIYTVYGTIMSPNTSLSHPYEILSQGISLSPDEQYVVVQVRNKVTNCRFLSKFAVSNLAMTPLDEAGCSGGYYPSISPDGSKIAYIRDDNLWIMNTDGTNIHKIRDKASGGTITAATMRMPKWSSDGSQIAVLDDMNDSATPGHDGRIIAVDPVTGGVIREIKTGLDMPRGLVWSDPSPIMPPVVTLHDINDTATIDLTTDPVPSCTAETPGTGANVACDITYTGSAEWGTSKSVGFSASATDVLSQTTTINGNITVTNPKALVPGLSCVVDEGGGDYTARFGYSNPNFLKLLVPIGASNEFTPSPADRGQPDEFEVGNHPDGVAVGFSGGAQTWNLTGNTTFAETTSVSCP